MKNGIYSAFKLLITDVDGVLTDGRAYYSDEGKIQKKFGPHDSDGIKFFRALGIDVIAITADKRGFSISKRRTDDMSIKLHHVTEAERLSGVMKIADGMPFAFIGDGYHDIKVFSHAAVSYTTLNALTVVKAKANIILPVEGGNGALLLAFEHYLSAFEPDKYEAFMNGTL